MRKGIELEIEKNRKLKYNTMKKEVDKHLFFCHVEQTTFSVYVLKLSQKKMPAQTLLEISPNELFEKHNINEIKNIQIQIQNEIERKREELRTMVGEKCRDLLKAADTITEMKETAQNVIFGITRMKELCQTLQKRFSGFKPQNNNPVRKISSSSEEISKVIEIKVLLSIPEQIWTAIDIKDYLLATQLFLFATHLHLSLEVSSNAQKISDKFPVVTKQWEIIKSCKKIITEGSQNELKVNNLSHQKATECLCSLVLLEIMSYEKLLGQFLQLRMLSLEDILRSEELSRKKLRLVVELLQNTLVVLFVCFVEKPGKQCALQTQLNLVTGEEGKPTLSKTIHVSSLPEQYLSPLVLNYRPKTPSTLTTLSLDYVKSTFRNWLEKVENFLKVEITQLLSLIEDIKRLDKIIKEEVLSLGYPQNWDEIVDSLLEDNKLNIYQQFIKSYVTERVKSLIQITWQNNVNSVLVHLTKMDEEISKERKKQQPENDIRWFVWKESKLDTEEGLKFKTLGYTSRVMELCRLMDSFLSQLLEDVTLYVGEDMSPKSKTEGIDADLILPFLNSCSFEMLKRFTRSIKESYRERESANSESNIIIRARFLSSLTTLCPSLEKCLKQIHTFQEDFNESKTNNIWQEAVVFLNEESIQMWEIWRNLATSKFQSLIKSKLDQKISLRNLLKSKPLSEIITIEEQTEDDTTVKSDLKVPSQPSLPLQELLFQICQQMNAIAPHTLPSRIHQSLVDSLVKDILEHYEEWSKSEVIYQSQAWQMLLDIRFLTLLVVTKENKDLSQSICDVLEKKIDPFDLDVYFPHLQNSVKKSALKLQGTFGVLINFTEKLPVFNGLKLSQTGSKVEEPNLLAVSSNVPWFPLLPVTNFGSRRADQSRFEGQDSSSFKEFSSGKASSKEKENKKESVTSDFFKSAGAFFDAMTGGWS